LLRATVLVGGAAVMVVEILGSRMLAPTFGTTLHVWSALITVTLAALATGYALGGRLADRRPGLGPLMVVVGSAAGTLLLADLATKPVLRLAYEAGMVGGTFVAATILFLPTLLLLGMVSPMAVRAAADRQHLGRSVGNLYALSTVGSVAGSLAVSLLLIPHLGIHTALAATAIALGLIPLWHLLANARRHLAALLAVVLALAVVSTKVAGDEADRYIFYTGTAFPVIERASSAYGDLVISDFNQTRYMFLNGVNQGSLRENASAAHYSYGLLRLITAKGLPKSVLIWGLGPGVIARALAEAGVQVTVIEIDPVIVRLARQYFGLPEAVRVMVGDARIETARLEGTYEAIVLDAFSGDAPPFHLLTREAMLSLRERLAPQGLIAANIVGGTRGEEARVVSSVAVTMEEVFGQSFVFAPHPEYLAYTMFLCAGAYPETPAPFTLPVPDRFRPYVDTLFASRTRLPREQALVLTDAYAPLDAWNDAAVRAMRYPTVRRAN
jgi:spermidine synthase